MQQPLDPRQDALRRYFTPLPTPPDRRRALLRIGGCAAVMAVGFLFWIASPSWLGRFVIGSAFFFVGLGMVARFAWLYAYDNYLYQQDLAKAFPKPTHTAVNQWLTDAIQRIRAHSLERLALSPEDCDFVDLPPIIGPILWVKAGIDPADITWIQGNHAIPHCGVYQVAFLWLAKFHLGIFSCDYNLIRDAILNEEIYEFFYQDIGGISVKEQASALTLKTGQSLKSAQELRISVANDRYFTFTLGAEQLQELTGTEFVPKSGVEVALSAVRKRMQDAKAGLLRSPTAS